MTHYSFLMLLVFFSPCILVWADLGEVNTALKYHLEKCLTRGISLQTNVAHLLQCIESSVYHCLLFHDPMGIQYITEMNGICGVINPGQLLTQYIWNIHVHSKFNLSIDFLHFHLPLSQDCKHTHASLKFPGRRYERLLLQISAKQYCGHRKPWNLSFPRSHVSIMFFTEQPLAKCYFIVVTFEAFDINLPSVGFAHKVEYLSWTSPTDISFVLTRNVAFSMFKTEFHIHFISMCIKYIIVRYPTTLITWQRNNPYITVPEIDYHLSDVSMFDGPGVLSPVVVPSCNNRTCTCYLSSYQGLLKYRIPIPSNYGAGLKQLPYDHSKVEGITWKSHIILNKSVDCIQKGGSIHFHSKSGICWGMPFHNSIVLKVLYFSGYNTELSNGKQCAYGGLFIVLYEGRHTPTYDHIELCFSLNSKLVLPYNVQSSTLRMIIVFKAFNGYSDGSVDLSISQDISCVGMNHIGFTTMCAYYHDRYDSWSSSKDEPKYTFHHETCTDYWLIHPFWHPRKSPSELGSCVFPIKPSKLRRTAGSFKFSVTGSTAYPNVTSSSGSLDVNNFNMTIEADTVRDFPFSLNTEKTIFSLKIPTTNIKTFLFNPASSLQVKLNYTGDSQWLLALLIIRMQIVENVICSSVENHQLTENTQIYTFNSNISDVYLSRLYPYNGYMVKSMNYTGHSSESCRVVVKGQAAVMVLPISLFILIIDQM